MSRESEKALKAMHQFLEENGAEGMPMDEVNQLLQKFTTEYNGNLPGRVTEKTAKTADDYLELAEAGMMTLAARQYEEMIRLSENDNLGARYSLMHVYAYLEQEEPALKLHKKYDGYEETQMLLPLSVLYFKRGDFDKAEEYLKRLCAANKDTKKFFRAIKRDKLDHYVEEISGYGYRPFTIQELIVELMENSFLFRTVPLYMEWAYEKTRNM